MANDFSKVQLIEITDHHDGQRLDNYLFKTLKNVPKTRVYRILRKGEVRLNKKRCKASDRIQRGDIVRIPPIRLIEKQVQTIPESFIARIIESIVFEDEHLLVINKPSGIAVHKGSGVDYGVIEALKQSRGADFIELAHRIDRDTSGLLLLAKSRSTLLHLQEQITSHSMRKTYRTLLAGDAKKTTINAPLRKGSILGGERMVTVAEDGKHAITHLTPLEYRTDATLVNAQIETGRTHQIRVHTAHINHPIIGDKKYGDKAINQRFKALGIQRLSLHALELALIHPHTHKQLILTAPPPDYLQKASNSCD